MDLELVDTVSVLKTFLDGLKDIPKGPPSLYVDLEGNNLSRMGTLSLVNILVEPWKKVYLIDVTTLGKDAFDVCGSNECRLRDVLESSETIKVFFDIRNDSDALYSLYGVHVQGIWDLQLMELASRDFQKRCVNGLAKCIERDSRIGIADKERWQKVKNKGRDLFDPARGGSYGVFDQRPLTSEVEDYCTQDVALMPHLCEIYREKLCDAWWRKIEVETEARIRLSQSANFHGKGRHMAEGPRAWTNWRPSAAERKKRTLFIFPVQHCIAATTSTATETPENLREPTPQSSASLSKLFEDMKLEASDLSYETDSDSGVRLEWDSDFASP